jgi:hypothetical protein
MLGKATLVERTDVRFDYCERGRLTIANGQILDAERCYVFAEDDRGFSVWFAENPLRLFHQIALYRRGEALEGTAVHLCGDDRYDSRYEFRTDGSFIVAHAVRGPRKTYTIETRYTRER